MKGMKVAVVGAGGFIARHLSEELHTAGCSLSLFARREGGSAAFPFQSLDLRDRDALAKCLKGMDLVYYLVSETIPATSWNDPMVEIEKNLIPFTHFMEVVASQTVRKVSFISSAGTVYGTTAGKVDEDFDKKPFSPYGIMKLTMENLLRYYQVRSGVQYDVFRVSNVYGEGQDTGKGIGIINTFIEKILSEGKVNIFGDGSSTRNYIYVKDVAKMLATSVNNAETSGVFNVASDATLSINGLLEVMKGVVKEPFDVVYQEGRPSDNSYIDLDNARMLARMPGFRFTPIADGIRRTYDALSASHTK